MRTHLLFLFCALPALLIAADVIDEDVDGFHLVMGNSEPSFKFYLGTNETDVYTFSLVSVFELNTKTKEKYADTVAKFTAWEVSAVAEEEDGKLFTISHGVGLNPSGGPQFASLHLINHLHESDSKTSSCSGVSCLKFDIHLKDYSWVSADPNAAVVLEFTMVQEGSPSYLVSPENFQVHDAYYSIFHDATVQHSDGSTSTIAPYLILPPASASASKYTVWLVYDHFEGSVVHDPTVMILHLGDYQHTMMIVGASIAGVVLLVVGIIFGVLLYRNKTRPGYQEM